VESCARLEGAGAAGLIPPQECERLQYHIAGDCECEEVIDPPAMMTGKKSGKKSGKKGMGKSPVASPVETPFYSPVMKDGKRGDMGKRVLEHTTRSINGGSKRKIFIGL